MQPGRPESDVVDLQLLVTPMSLLATLAAVAASGAAVVRFIESVTRRRRRLDLLEVAVGAHGRLADGPVKDAWSRVVRSLLASSKGTDAERHRRALVLVTVLGFSSVLVGSTAAAVLADPSALQPQPSTNSRFTVTAILFLTGFGLFTLAGIFAVLMIRIRSAPSRGSSAGE